MRDKKNPSRGSPIGININITYNDITERPAASVRPTCGYLVFIFPTGWYGQVRKTTVIPILCVRIHPSTNKVYQIFIFVNTVKISKGAKIRNRYNQVPHLIQDTNAKVTNSQLDTTNESQEVSPFPAGDHKAHINRRAQSHSNHKAVKKIHKRSTALERSVKYFTGGLKQV